MRAQKMTSRVWRLVAVFAITVYFYSFGIFLSRMVTSGTMTSLERHRMTSFMYESTRLFDGVRNETTLNESTGSSGAEASASLTRPTSDLRESAREATKALTSPAESKPEATKLGPEATKLGPEATKLGPEATKLGPEATKLGPEATKLEPEATKLGPEMTKLTPEESRMEVNLQRLLQSLKQSSVSNANSSLKGGSLTRHPQTVANYTSGDHVVNPHPFKYVINTETPCDNNSDSIFVVVYVHSAPDHHKRRMVIRQTWGDVRQYPVNVRIVFFTGSPATSGVQRAMAFEAEQYGDIVQEDFLDSYRNLTYKGVAALKWISTFCNRAKFVLKTDDDIFVNMFTLIRHLKRLDRRQNGTISHLLTCLVWYGMPVLRSGKWMVSKEEWKEDTYPTYCSGSAFVMTTDVAVALHNASYYVPFFWVDDFYVTGLLPLRLGTIQHVQFISAYVLEGGDLESKFTGAQWYKYIFCHVSDMTAIQRVWKKVVAINKGEFIPTIQFVIPQVVSSTSLPPSPH